MAKKKVKGLNMDKVVEIRNEVEEVMEMSYTCSDCGVKLKHEEVFLRNDFIYCDKCSTKIDELGNLLNDEVEEMKDMNTNKDMEIVKEMNEMKNKLDLGIRNAILAGKKETRTEKFVSGKRIKAILNNYKIVTGEEMSDVQVNYIKTLNSTQIYNIELTIGALNREIRVEKFNQRMSQVMA